MRRVLFSVTDKTGLALFAKGLRKRFPQVEIAASGGTAKLLEDEGISHTPIAEITRFPECFNGRVKTLHPALFGGILYRRGIDDKEAANLGVEPIDLVVCNLYRFDPNHLDSMDIGGPAMIRAACKNYASVAVLTDPADYALFLEELESKGMVSIESRKNLAAKAMQMIAKYEAVVADAFASETCHIPLERGRKLSYGENPDQEGWVFSFPNEKGIASSKVLGGKALSYNNYEDASQAFFALQRIASVPGVAILKHGGLCGYATGKTLSLAFQRAWEGDPKSAFGSIVAFSQEVGEEFSDLLKSRFVEVLLAPSFSPSFVAWAAQAKPSLRLLEIELDAVPSRLFRGISGGMLAQTPKKSLFSSDASFFQPLANKIGVATKMRPRASQEGAFRFALAAVQSVKSNAIVLVREYELGFYQLIGVGGGQPNRIDSLQRLALPKAIENLQQESGKEDVREALGELVLASDGFFPFSDSIQAAADAGIRYFLQPGGSMRDEEVIQEADRRGLTMIFTGQRYFSH